MASREHALAAYRLLLRSIPVAFRGDQRLLLGARQQARQSFESNRQLGTGSEEFEQSIQHARDVAKMLRQNVVQSTAEGEDHYRLRLHDEIERGDNETIKTAGQRLKEKTT
ncbi:MAG: Mitochondrial zinc maintenance protein 1, mitochondrial [Chrysothrix sp. TS-e1954]|nr:MAG: Mitochondrial zinc maintenance protein 1, mitochondrial [Chrysothrix sp. TS-e1954]